MSMAVMMVKVAVEAKLRGLSVKYFVFDEEWADTFWWRSRLQEAGIYVIE